MKQRKSKLPVDERRNCMEAFEKKNGRLLAGRDKPIDNSCEVSEAEVCMYGGKAHRSGYSVDHWHRGGTGRHTEYPIRHGNTLKCKVFFLDMTILGNLLRKVDMGMQPSKSKHYSHQSYRSITVKTQVEAKWE